MLDSVFSDPEHLMELLKNDYDKYRSFEVTSYQSLAAHELGHNAHICLAMKRRGFEYGKPITREEAFVLKNQENTILNEIYDMCFPGWNKDYETVLKHSIADFGTISVKPPQELIAQAFSKYYYGKKKSRIAKEMVEYYKRELSQYV